MKINVINSENTVVGTTDAPETLFETQWNGALVKRAFIAQEANSRVQHSHLRSRSDVQGGGRKPWRQKGTGRARHGSIRSPLWKGGGVAFGGAIHNFFKKINKKERRMALCAIFSRRYRDGALRVVESFDGTDGKKARTALTKLMDGKKALIVVSNANTAFYRSARNVPEATFVRAGSLNVKDLMNHNTVLVEQAALQEIATGK